MRKKNIKKQIWLDQTEANELKVKSSKALLSESEFIRLLIMDTKIKEKPGEEFYEAIKELRAIGNNLNQIAKVANSTGNINEIYYQTESKKWNQFIIDIKRNFLN